MKICGHALNPSPYRNLVKLVAIRLLIYTIPLTFALGQFSLAAPSKRKRHSPVTLRTRAETAFKAGDYDKAVDALRRYLQKYPKDYDSWNLLAASYYHSGLPARAARYLKFVAKKTTQKSYNFYYQGLAYNALGKPRIAKEKYSYAARFINEYGARSSFEMAVLEYNAKAYDKASYWINLYLQRYPNGYYAGICQKMQQSIRSGNHISGLVGNKKPDMDKALFRYNKMSLSPKPHYWFAQLGSTYDQGSQRAPTPKGTLKTVEFVDYALLANVGIGYGPVRKNDSLAFGGYTYRQRWNTETDRIQTFLEDFDPTYFPFRGDILERSHEFYGDFRQKIRNNFFAGVFARKEFRFEGSNLIPGPDQPSDITASALTSDTSLAIPWLGVSYLQNYYTLFYLYLRKQLNSLTSEYSNKSFSLFGNDEIVMSYGVSHTMEFPANRLRVNIEAFQYEFVYNDYWLDYNRLGAIFAGEYEFYPKFFIRGLFGFYNDTYIRDQLKQYTCSFVGWDRVSAPSELPKNCRRTDEGQLLEIAGFWNYSQFHRLEGSVRAVSNKNPALKVYDKSKYTLNIRLTWAFPSTERVIRYVDRFADSAFTKEAE